MKLNNKGLSLVEIVVYMVVSIFIIGYVFNTLSNITRSFAQEKKKAVLQMDGQDAISLLSRDMSTTGFKHFLDTSYIDDSILYRRRVLQGTYLRQVLNDFPLGEAHPSYDASFLIYPDTLYDEVEIFRAKMKDAHTLDTVQRLTYYYDDSSKQLKREMRSYPVFVDDFDFDSDTSSKYDICHFPDDASSNEHTITISASSVVNHLEHHDDYMGACREDDTSDNNVDENWWDYDPDNDIYLLRNITAFKVNFSADFDTWYNNPPNPNEMNYMRIMVLVRTDEEGTIINSPTFNLGIGMDEIPLTYTPPAGNKYIYRLYERTVEIPSNGRI